MDHGGIITPIGGILNAEQLLIKMKIGLDQKNKKVFLSAFFMISGFFSGCACKESAEVDGGENSPDLQNIELDIRDLAGKPARLVNGVFEGDHLHIEVLQEETADLNQDGLIDGVVIIVENSGGSGNFREICLMLNNGNKLIHTDMVFIGDRIRVTNFQIDENIIMIDYIDRAENDAFSIDPYIGKRVYYRVQGKKLRRIN